MARSRFRVLDPSSVAEEVVVIISECESGMTGMVAWAAFYTGGGQVLFAVAVPDWLAASYLSCLLMLGKACKSCCWMLRLGSMSLIYSASKMGRRLKSVHLVIISVFSSIVFLVSFVLWACSVCVLGVPDVRW